MILPNFLIVGAQKCGTTSLHEILAVHPQTNMSRVKEINFFINTKKYERGLNYYSSFFQDINALAVGESSPGYLCYPDMAKKIKTDLGDIRIIVMLRDPIRRAFSQYWDNRRHLSERLTEEEIINEYLEPNYNPQRKGYFSRGVYEPQVRDYIDVFGAENVKIVFLEELISRQKDELQNIYTFLGLDTDKGLQSLPKASNQSTVFKNPFYNFFLSQPKMNRYLPKRMRRLFLFGPKQIFKYKLPSQDLLQKLKEFYDPYNKDLKILLGRELPWES